ncbi:hypothetical protein D3C85_1046390 [compost metagenome]
MAVKSAAARADINRVDCRSTNSHGYIAAWYGVGHRIDGDGGGINIDQHATGSGVAAVIAGHGQRDRAAGVRNRQVVWLGGWFSQVGVDLGERAAQHDAVGTRARHTDAAGSGSAERAAGHRQGHRDETRGDVHIAYRESTQLEHGVFIGGVASRQLIDRRVVDRVDQDGDSGRRLIHVAGDIAREVLEVGAAVPVGVRCETQAGLIADSRNGLANQHLLVVVDQRAIRRQAGDGEVGNAAGVIARIQDDGNGAGILIGDHRYIAGFGRGSVANGDSGGI